METLFLHDHFEETLWPLLRLKPLFLLRDGVLTPLERARLTRGDPTHTASDHTPAELSLFTKLYALPQFEARPVDGVAPVRPAALLEKIGENIAQDAALLKCNNYYNPAALHIVGEAAALYAPPTAQLSPHAVFDTTAGPIVLGDTVRVGAFCLLQGPLYIGAQTQLDRCHIVHSVVGTQCRLGGEIADSIIGDYSNKHHEGFLGHSLVGDWVNLGALTTTSDLKNNYGEVVLSYKETNYSTKTIKFGSIIGDYVKTGIGTLLNTGTVIDIGANLFGQSHWSGYIERFSWGVTDRYDRTRFLRDANRMMQRRGKHVSAELEELLDQIFSMGLHP